MKKIRVLIVDDHASIASGIEKQLNDDRIEVIGSALDSGASLHNTDVLLLDLTMPQSNGVELLSILKNSGYLGKIIVHTSCDDDELISDCKKRGADGYILESTDSDTLKEIIIRVEEGQKIFPN